MATPALLAQGQQELAAELRRFTGDDPGRSAAVHVLDEPALSAEVRADVVRPAGSLVKILPALALYRAAERGELDLDATVPRGSLGTTMYPTILAAFSDDRPLKLREVCAFSLMTSDNPAAEYIFRLVGPDRVEQICRELRLAETAVIVGFRDEELGSPGRRNSSTVREAPRIIEHLASAPDLGELRRFLFNYQRNTRIPVRLPDEVPVMHKTGTLATVVNDAGVIHHPAGRIALAYFCDGQADKELTSVEIGDSALRITEIVAAARR